MLYFTYFSEFLPYILPIYTNYEKDEILLQNFIYFIFIK